MSIFFVKVSINVLITALFPIMSLVPTHPSWQLLLLFWPSSCLWKLESFPCPPWSRVHFQRFLPTEQHSLIPREKCTLVWGAQTRLRLRYLEIYTVYLPNVLGFHTDLVGDLQCLVYYPEMWRLILLSVKGIYTHGQIYNLTEDFERETTADTKVVWGTILCQIV